MPLSKIEKKQQLQWEAEEDVNLMTRYDKLMSDPPRLQRALKRANEMVKEMEDGAKLIKKVANTKKIK